MRSAFTALVLATGLITRPLAAQSRHPGAPGGDGRGAGGFLAEYYAEVLERAEELTTEWRRAWREDDLPALSELYLEDAQIVFSDAPTIDGEAAIRAFFVAELPRLGEIQTSLTDFDASGRMAYLYGPFQLDRRRPDGTMERISGRYLTILLNRQRTWSIRSQFFSLEGPPQALPPSLDR